MFLTVPQCVEWAQKLIFFKVYLFTQVAVRVRPMTEQEILAGGTQVAHPVDKQVRYLYCGH